MRFAPPISPIPGNLGEREIGIHRRTPFLLLRMAIDIDQPYLHLFLHFFPLIQLAIAHPASKANTNMMTRITAIISMASVQFR